MILFFSRICSMRNTRRKRNPSFRLGNASLFCPLSPSPSKKKKNNKIKEGKLASYSRVRSLPSLPRSLSPMLKKGLEPC